MVKETASGVRAGDRYWIWGQDAGSHHACRANKTWKLPGVNRMGPAAGAAYLGLRRMFRVVMSGKPEPPFDAESETLRHLDELVWSAVGDKGSRRHSDSGTDLDEVLRQAARFPNVTGAVLDDFFRAPVAVGPAGRLAPGTVAAMQARLHAFPDRPLALWAVWYASQIDWAVSDYLDFLDGITVWSFEGRELPRLGENLERWAQKAPRQRRLAGLYLWNYGEGCPFSRHDMQTQCETAFEAMRRGWVEGLVFCSNCVADLGLDAVDWTRGWIRETAEEPVASRPGA